MFGLTFSKNKKTNKEVKINLQTQVFVIEVKYSIQNPLRLLDKAR